MNNVSVGIEINSLNHNSLRAKTFQAEAIMKTMPDARHLTKLFHHFAPGLYARELHIPAGMTLTGQIHKFKNLNILSQGTMLVSTEEGVIEVSAPFTVVSPAGTKRIAYAKTDCVWTTILATDETNVPTIERLFVTDSEDEWLEFSGENQLKLGLD